MNFYFVLTNSTDPDKMPHKAAFNLVLRCLPKYPASVFVIKNNL